MSDPPVRTNAGLAPFDSASLGRSNRSADPRFRRGRTRPGEDALIVEARTFDGERIEQYWLNPPFSYAVITHETEDDQHYYHAVEPRLDRFERDILETLYDDVRVSLLYTERDGEPHEVLRLRRQRRQEMFTYLVVYVSFLVFLVVIAALEYVLIPSLLDVSALGEGATAGAGIGLEGGDVDAYRAVFFDTALIQASLSGVAAGVMGSGSIKDGMKHTAIMLSITYFVLTVLL